MESEIIELQKKIDALTEVNAELLAFKQEYSSSKQSIARMSARLRKLCKRLTPNSEIVVEMQAIADEIRDLVKSFT
ncbi:MAG: hypothetical protein H0X51_08575 [Parachlamydiaceae bacterium]|nr:hypothetical protein [Parachlamydiaceae bacterium]